MIRAQTNDRLLMLMLYDCATDITSDTILFADAVTTHLPCPGGGTLRKITDAELLAFSKSARYMCSPMANLGKPLREPFVI